MSRWFRVHDDLVDDPKVQLLSGEMVKSLLNLWCLASQNDGLLPPMKDMAFKLRMKPQQVAAIIAELSAAELIDHEGGEYRPHNWDKRQYKSDTDKTAAERAKRYRAKNRDGNGAVTRDADRDGNGRSERPETEADTEQKQSKKDTREVALLSGFDDFWNLWPNKVGKPAAVKAYRSAINRGVSQVDLVCGVAAYTRDKPADRPWLNPATFLNQNRWEDRPATIAKPLTEFQRKQQETNDVRAELRNFGSGGRGSGALDRLLPDYHRERSEGLRSGTGQALLELPGASNRGGH